MAQGPRLEIIIDSRRAQRNTEALEDSLSDLEEQGTDAADSLRNVGDEASNATGKFASFRQQLNEIVGNTPIGGMINDVNEKLSALNGTAGVAAAGLAGLAVGGIAVATTALIAMSIEAAKADAELAVLARRANVSTQNFQILQYAAEQLGMSQDGLGQSLADAQEKLGEFTASGGSGEAADFFEALKNNTKITDEQIQKFAKTLQGKDGVEALQLMKDKLDEIGASAQEQRFVFESLGNDLGNLLPLFTSGGVLLDDFGRALEEAGIIKSKDAIKQSQLLAAQVQAVNIQYQGFKNELISGFTPALVDVGNAMFGTSKNGVQLQEVGQGLGVVFKSIAHFAISTATAVEFLGNALGGMAAIGAQIADKANLANLTPVGLAKAAFDSRKEINAILKDMDEQSSNLVLASAERLDALWAEGGSSNNLVKVINALTEATDQNNTGLQVNAKEAKDAEKAALDAAKAREKLTDQTKKLNDQQEKARERIKSFYADDFEKLNIDFQNQIKAISDANFKTDESKYIAFAQKRYDFNTEMYLRQITQEINSYKWSEEEKLKYSLETEREIIENSGKYNDELKALKLDALKVQTAQELAWIELDRQQRLLRSRQFYLSESELMKERYRLEREEIEKNIKLSEEERRQRIQLSKDEEQSALLNRAASTNRAWQSSFSEMTNNTQMFQLDQTRQDRTGQSLAVADSQNADVMARAQDPNADMESLAAEQEAIWQAHRDRMALIDQDYWSKTKAYQLGMAADVFGGLSGVMLNFVGESSSSYRALVAIQKGANLASVLMNSVTAISAAWASAPFPYNLPAVAMATMETGALQATLQAFSPQGFATGGQILGAGTNTSDSIPIWASNEEFMFKAKSAKSIGLADLNYMNRTGELPPNRDDVQLNAIQRQQRQTDLINTSISQRNTGAIQNAAPTVVDNQMKVVILDDRQAMEQEMMGPSGEKAFLYHWKRNQSKLQR